MASILLWPELMRLAERARRRFRLSAFTLEPLTHPRARIFGDCDIKGNPKRIRIRVHQLDGRRPLSRSMILVTLAHELAHLRQPSHNAEWKALNNEILDWMET